MNAKMVAIEPMIMDKAEKTKNNTGLTAKEYFGKYGASMYGQKSIEYGLNYEQRVNAIAKGKHIIGQAENKNYSIFITDFMGGAANKPIIFVQDKESGLVVQEMFWMDIAEFAFPANYQSLPIQTRASLEAEYKLKHFYQDQDARSFNTYKANTEFYIALAIVSGRMSPAKASHSKIHSNKQAAMKKTELLSQKKALESSLEFLTGADLATAKKTIKEIEKLITNEDVLEKGGHPEVELTFLSVDENTGNFFYKGTDGKIYVEVEGVVHDTTDAREPLSPVYHVVIKTGEPIYNPADRFGRNPGSKRMESPISKTQGFDEWRNQLIEVIKTNAQLSDSEIALIEDEIKEYYGEGKTPEQVFFEIWHQDAGHYYKLFEEGGKLEPISGKKINWRQSGFTDKKYFYGYNNGTFYATEADNITKDLQIKDIGLVFALHPDKDLPGQRESYISQLSKLFPELTGKEVKSALDNFKMESGGGFDLQYQSDPEYIDADNEYQRLLLEQKRTDPHSTRFGFLQDRIETLQARKKRIALGEKYQAFHSKPIHQSERKNHRPHTKHHIMGSVFFAAGGKLDTYEKRVAYWNAEARKQLLGKIVKAYSYMTLAEAQALGWEDGEYDACLVIEFTDGTIIYASQDDEGNGPGFFNLYSTSLSKAATVNSLRFYLPGSVVTAVEYISKQEAAEHGWEFEIPLFIEFSNKPEKTECLVLRDPEGNGGGALFGQDAAGNEFTLPTMV